MYEFDFWYAYFDSLFLKPQPIPHLSFIQTYKFNLKQLAANDFPECKKLPQLSKCFQKLQKFIYSEKTWISCECEQSILGQTEKCINIVAILINIQKKYAQDFWHLKRRVQASICHLFSLLVFFMFSLIPGNDMGQSIESTKKCNKLCTSLKVLETLVNNILPEMNPIIKFLYQESFSQEKKLTILFLQEVKQVLLNLPTISKKKFKNQFQLSRYLYVIIPIQLSENQYKFKSRRKKAATISNQIEMKYHSDEVISNSSRKKSFDEVGSRQKRFSLSKLQESPHKQIYRTKIFKKNNQHTSIQEHSIENITNFESSFLKLFQFSEKVRKCSFYITQKKITKATLNTRQTMELRIEFEKQRKKSDFGKTSKSHSRQKQFGRTFSIGKRQLKTNQTIRSKKSSLYRARRKTQIEEVQKHRHHKQKSIAKQKLASRIPTIQIVNKPILQQIPLLRPTKKVNLYSGDARGWGIIQEEVNKKIAKFKIHQLIHSTIIN